MCNLQCNLHCFWKLCPCLLKITVGRMLSYVCMVPPRYIPIKYQFVKSLYNSRCTLLRCSRNLPDHFLWCQYWIFHPSLVSVSQYKSLLIVTPAESQSISSIPCQSKKIVTICLDSGAIGKYLGCGCPVYFHCVDHFFFFFSGMW
jgi:hypothetical protein